MTADGPPDEQLVAPDVRIDWRTFRSPHPPSRELGDWLWNLAPPGAFVLPLFEAPPGEKLPADSYGRRGVPLLRVAAEDPAPLSRQGRDLWLQGRVPTFHPREYREQMVPGGIARHPTRGPIRGQLLWRMRAAGFRDLHGWNTATIAERFHLGDSHSVAAEGGSRTARRYVEQGRAELAALGAWPWCMEPEGKPEPDWWRNQRYAEALRDWHLTSCVDALEDVLHAVAWGAGSRDRSKTMNAYVESIESYQRTYDRARRPR